MKIGAMDNVLVKPWSELFDEAARLGFDGVELDLKAETYRDSEVWSERGRRALVDRSRGAGVEIASVCMASVAGLVTKTETHDQGMEALADLRRFCDELGAGVILFPMIKQPEQSEDDAVDLWRDGFKTAFAESDGARAKVGMESVGRVGRSADQALAMIEAVGSPVLGVYYDVGNADYQSFDGIAEMKQLGSHIVQIHVKEIGAEMGEGKLDFPAIFSTIREIGYDGYLMLETEAGDDPAANALRNLEFVRSLL
ncbi:MAG TPA: sugar phosphate isomerase/epimerase family protein [Armatimonadota bacterium]|nr:sugar phosphate isomerase/epimerase family protein [Armatimonadota bacterium]